MQIIFSSLKCLLAWLANTRSGKKNKVLSFQTGLLCALTLLLAACAFVLGRHMDDAIGVDVECDLDLRDSTRGWRDSYQSKLTQQLVVCRHLSLTLAHFDLHLSLSISCCGEHLEGNMWHCRSHGASLRLWDCSPALNTWLFLVGIVVFLLMSLVKTPPRVSIPSDSGVTSKSSTSVTSPARTPPWMAAPIATASSGFTDLLGARPNRSWTVCWTCSADVVGGVNYELCMH